MEWEEPRADTEEPTPYIGQVLDVAFKEAQAFLVLLTGDDEGRLRERYQGLQDPEYEQVYTPQARQNVLFARAQQKLPLEMIIDGTWAIICQLLLGDMGNY